MVTLSHHDRMLRALALLHRCALSFQTFRPFGLEPFRLCHPVITPGHATTPVYLARPFLIDRHPFGRALTPFDAKASLDSPRSLVFFPSKDNLVHGSVQTATCNEFYPVAFVWSAQPFWTAWQRCAFARSTSLFRHRTTLTSRFGYLASFQTELCEVRPLATFPRGSRPMLRPKAVHSKSIGFVLGFHRVSPCPWL